MEKTLVILKPNAVQRELVGDLISRFEKRGLKITAMKMMTISNEMAAAHYNEHKDKPFFSELIGFMSSGPSVILLLESDDALHIVRTMAGNTDPAYAAPGTIRGDYATSPGHNMIHASDSADAAIQEIAIFFSEEEIQDYRLAVRPWL